MSLQTTLEGRTHGYTSTYTIFNDPPQVDCPFCLHRGPITTYYIHIRPKRKGLVSYSEKKMRCPSCNTTMLKRTLKHTTRLSPEHYAEWLYEEWAYDRRNPNESTRRIHWDAIKQRLRELGCANAFWEAWRFWKQNPKSTGYEWRKLREEEQNYERMAQVYEAEAT